jgi:hypothetical protein
LVNPFHPRGAANPRYFANRTEILDFFIKTVKESAKSKPTKPDNMALLGSWGIGKTSALQKFKGLLKDELRDVYSFSTIFSIKPAYCASSEMFTLALLENLSKEYDVSAPIEDKVRQTVVEEVQVWKKWGIKSLSLTGPNIERKGEKAAEISLVEALYDFWKKVEDKGVQIVIIMLDDIHYLLQSEWKGSFYDLRTDIQSLSAKGCKFMFIITGPTLLYPEIRGVAEPFTRLFERYDLAPFDFDGTKDAINKPLKVERIPLSFSDDVIQKIHEISMGYPFFVTLIMKDLLYKYNKGKITEKEFDKVLPEIRKHFAKVRFEGDIEKTTESEKIILLRMARLRKEEVSHLDVKAAGSLFERLVKKDLIIKVGRGKYKLYHSLFKEYLKTLKS